MSQLAIMRNAVVTTLKTDLSTWVNEVKTHRGPMDSLEEVQRVAQKAPAVVVPFPRVISSEDISGTVIVNAQWSTFVLAKDIKGVTRDVLAASIAEIILQKLPENRWGLDLYGAPQRIEGRQLYNTKLDKTGLALWAIAWTQQLELGAVGPATLNDLITVHGDHYAGPGEHTDINGLDIPVATNEQTLPQ